MADQNLTFQGAYEELQTITKAFETNELDLETCIPKFKRAAELVAFLKKRLNELENQIEEIDIEGEEKVKESDGITD